MNGTLSRPALGLLAYINPTPDTPIEVETSPKLPTPAKDPADIVEDAFA